MSERSCQVPGCKHRVRARQLMCPPHWDMVPKPLQREVNASWAECRGNGGKLTRTYMIAVRRATNAVQGIDDEKDDYLKLLYKRQAEAPHRG